MSEREREMLQSSTTHMQESKQGGANNVAIPLCSVTDELLITEIHHSMRLVRGVRLANPASVG